MNQEYWLFCTPQTRPDLSITLAHEVARQLSMCCRVLEFSTNHTTRITKSRAKSTKSQPPSGGGDGTPTSQGPTQHKHPAEHATRDRASRHAPSKWGKLQKKTRRTSQVTLSPSTVNKGEEPGELPKAHFWRRKKTRHKKGQPVGKKNTRTAPKIKKRLHFQKFFLENQVLIRETLFELAYCLFGKKAPATAPWLIFWRFPWNIFFCTPQQSKISS